jgi:uncharacterized protein (TIGR02466 family)
MKDPVLFNPFGTTLLRHTLPVQVFEPLKEKVFSLKNVLGDEQFVRENSHAEYLAGKNSYQIRLDTNFQKQIDLESYVLSLAEYYLASYNQQQKLQMGTTWVNYTYAGDSNPIHTHDALLSGVIYIKQDAAINDEMNEYTGRNKHGKPGMTHFIHKLENNRFDKTTYSNTTTPGELVMFPSWLAHFVNAHHNEGERITVAFNILEK